MKNIIKIIFPVFNAYISMFGFLGIYIFAGGKMTDKVGFLFFPIIIALIYGGYVGYKAVER